MTLAKKKKTVILIVSGTVILTMLIGGLFLLVRNNSKGSSSRSNNYPVNKPTKNDPSPIPPKKDNPDPEQPNQPKPTPPPNNNSEKKELANLIKNDLTTILKNKNASYRDLYSYHQLHSGIIYITSGHRAVKKELSKYNQEITPDNLEPEDWKEIVNLVRQLEKKFLEKNEQEEQQKKERLTNNPQLFYYLTSGSIERNGSTFSFKNFLGKRNGADFHLYIAENHPTLINIGSHLDKTENERFFLITGFAEPNNNHFKFIDSTDKITITSQNS